MRRDPGFESSCPPIISREPAILKISSNALRLELKNDQKNSLQFAASCDKQHSFSSTRHRHEFRQKNKQTNRIFFPFLFSVKMRLQINKKDILIKTYKTSSRSLSILYIAIAIVAVATDRLTAHISKNKG